MDQILRDKMLEDMRKVVQIPSVSSDKENVEKVWQFIQDVTIDKREGGEWYAYTTVEGKLLGKPMVDEWKCPYHNGRMCLRVMERNL